jgi:hypothetical protein
VQITAFKIRNFRSIVDTGWVSLSMDNVSALVGQNESGKSAILDALAATFSGTQLSADDRRHGDPPPCVDLRVTHSPREVEKALDKISNNALRGAVQSVFVERGYKALWTFEASEDHIDASAFDMAYELSEPPLLRLIEESLHPRQADAPPPAQEAAATSTPAQTSPASTPTVATAAAPAATSTPPVTPTSTGSLTPAPTPSLTPAAASADAVFDTFRQALFTASPTIIAFDESSGLLPDRVDISDDFKLAGSGAQAARNFLNIGDIDLKQLVNSDTRSRAAILKRANRRVTDGFLDFWHQTIGKASSLELECSIHHYPHGNDKAGKAYLEFLITDNATPLYPKQRSRGTRWFISFFLQLQASAVRGTNRIFLLDEPGANLHEKAQADVLNLIEKISPSIGVIYSTHSPHLISYSGIHRILAVERDPDTTGHPTRVIGSHALGAASIDTLSPILTAMGVALSRQSTIQRENNVILEELSAYYYLRAFWRLTGEKQTAHFLAATGTSHVAQLAQLFLGWGLDFIIVVDDESSGRGVYNSLKRDMFLDDPSWASARMLKVPNCDGIEDIFSVEDYRKHVLCDVTVTIEAGKAANSKWAKRNGAAKAIHALKLLKRVEAGEVQLKLFEAESQARIKSLVGEIAKRLGGYRASL